MTTWIMVVVGLLVYWIGLKMISGLINKVGEERDVQMPRIQYVRRVINTIWTIATCLALSLLTGISIHVFVSSVLALLGVALFAQWSILSNITASVIIFFFFPFRVGNWVRIIDGENSIEGEITEISLFHVLINGLEGELLTYPNSLVFQKAVSIRNKKPSEPLSDVEKAEQVESAH